MKTIAIVLVLALVGLASAQPASAEKASPPLEVDLKLELPQRFPGTATATLLAVCRVEAGSLTLQLDLPAAYRWIAGATRLADPPILSATHPLVVAFRVEAPTREAIVGWARLEAPGGLSVRRSAQISLLPPDDPSTAEPSQGAFQEKDGVARYPGRTRLAP